MIVVAVDPGREKCGVAVLDFSGVLYRRVIKTTDLSQEVSGLSNRYRPDCIVLGDGTTSREAKEEIIAACPNLKLTVVDEKHTTEEARREYWQYNPPRGWRRLLPRTMLTPPEPVDDLVAVILARRFLEPDQKRRND